MSEYSPKAIYGVYQQVKEKVPQAKLSGILGDSAHTYGYHRARAVLSGNDYSVQSSLDQKGDRWAASALDISLPPAQMKQCTSRLIAAMRAEDERTLCLREIFGTVNGSVVTGWDHGLKASYAGDDSWTSSDDSHLWHIHMSFYRAYTNDEHALSGLAAVWAGADIKPAPAPKPFKPTAANFPLHNQIFGLVSDPEQYRSGDPRYDGNAIRSYVKCIQDRLNALGYRAGFADGVYEAPTVAAMKRFQHLNGQRETGRCNVHDWAALFSPNAKKSTYKPVTVKIPAWPLHNGQYFGLISGPSASIGGYHASERVLVTKIQLQLVKRGYAPKTKGWSDGIFGPPTADAVKRLQKHYGLAQTGRVNITTWKVLWK